MRGFNKKLRSALDKDPTLSLVDQDMEQNATVASASAQPAEMDEEWEFMANMKSHKQRAKNKNKFKHQNKIEAGAQGAAA